MNLTAVEQRFMERIDNANRDLATLDVVEVVKDNFVGVT